MIGRAGIQDYLIGVAIFMLIIVGGVQMMLYYKDFDSTFTDDPEGRFAFFNETFDQTEELTRKTASLQANVETTEDDSAIKKVFGFLEGLINKSWNAIKLIGGNFEFITKMLLGLERLFGVPAWVAGTLTTIVSIFLVFIIYDYVFRRT